MVHQCLREKYSVRIHIGCIIRAIRESPLLITYYFLLLTSTIAPTSEHKHFCVIMPALCKGGWQPTGCREGCFYKQTHIFINALKRVVWEADPYDWLVSYVLDKDKM